MKTLLTTSAIVALLAGPVFAQGDTDQENIQPPAAADQMAPEDQAIPDDQTGAPAATGDEQPAPDVVAPEDAVQAPAEEKGNAVAEDQMFLDRQDESENLASNWMGKSVYNANDESLGDVNDLLLADDGSMDAVIIGVGGFLGLGEKNVAVPFEAIQAQTDENGNLKLFLQATAEQLDAAPEFRTLADIQAEERARAAETQAPGVAPAPAPAPGDSAM